jgi:hypothetical protein
VRLATEAVQSLEQVRKYVTFVAVLGKFKLKFVRCLDPSSLPVRVAPVAAMGTSFLNLALLAAAREEFVPGEISN